MSAFPRRFSALLGLVGLFLVAGGAWFYHTQEQSLRKRVENELTAIARLKAQQIADWRVNQLAEGAELAASRFFIEGVTRWLADPEAEPSEEILSRFRSLQGHYRYQDILLSDRNGRVRLSLSGRLDPLHAEAAQALAAALRDRKPVLTDLHTNEFDPPPHIGVLAPLFSGNEAAAQPIGAVILENDARQFLFLLIEGWPTPNRTAETLLVRRDGDSVLFLNELRHQANTALKLRIPLSQTNVPAVMAVLGQAGIVQGTDYRGVEVVAVVKAIPNSPWFMVAKMDAAEAFAVWRFESVLTLALMLALLALAGAVVFEVWQRNQKAHYRALYQAEAARLAGERRHGVTLRSIGDALIATDAEGRVELLNPVAETLTGWNNDEARGKPLADVFRIFNEETRQPVENPVQRVLREGRVIGLANHTLLLAKDGTERAIADSGAPMHDEQGRIVGVVLVFRDQTVERAAAKMLRESEQRFRRIYEQSPVGYQSLDPEGRILDVNPAWLTLLGYSREEVIGRRLDEFFTPASQAAFAEWFPRFRECGVTHGSEFEMRRKDGGLLTVAFDGVFVRDAQGRPACTHCVLYNVTERKQADEALRQSEDRYRLLVEESPDTIGIFQDETLQFINATGARQLGAKSKADLLGLRSELLIHPEDQPTALERIRRRLAGEAGVYPAEVRYVRMDGTIMPMEVSARPITFGGKPAIQFIARDITERKQAEAQLRKLSRAVEQSPASVVITDTTGAIEYVNPKFTQITGYSFEEALGQNPRILKSGEQPTEYYRQLWRTITAGGEWHGEFHNRKKNGELFWEAAAISPILDAAGKTTHFLAVKEDITERKRAEEVLQAERRLLRTLVDHLPVAIYVKDTAARKTLVNPVEARNLGVASEADALGKTDFDFYPRDEAERFSADDQRVLQDGQPVLNREEQFTRPDGAQVWSLTSKVPLRDAGGHITGLIGISVDVTEYHRVEEQLRRQAALLDAANDAIYIRSLDHTVTYWNDGAERLYGWSRAEALGRKMTELGGLDLEAFEAAHAALLAQGSWSGELKKIAKTGKPFDVFCRWTLLRDEAGRPAEVLAINTDITEKKQLETQFLRAQRLESVGALAGGIAHDLNNILTPILMSTALLRETNLDEESRGIINTVEQCAQRGADIIKQLLTFARGKPGTRVPLPIRHLLGEMAKLIRETFPRNIEAAVHAPKTLSPILGDATQIHQALMNLCVNARDAMPEGGTLSLAAENVTVDEAFAAMIPHAKPGHYGCVSVTDTGTGISAEHLDRIFEPFFTTKEVGKGTGLGLATVLGIVRGHDGFVRVKSRVGQGTMFEMYLPASPEAKASGPTAPGALPPPAHGEMLLVVDDEASVRAMLQRTLEKHGYRVLAAAEGTEALALFTRQRAEIRAVITDMMMPGIDGPTLVLCLRELEPRLPILGMTGLAERASVKGLEGLDLPVVLIKPFVGAKLLTALHEALAAPAGAPAAQPADRGE